MKKISQLFVVLFVVAIVFSSCTKCEICTLFDSNGTQLMVFEEKCDKDDREAMRTSVSAQALLISGSYTCE